METHGLRNMKGRLNTIWLCENSQDSLVVDSIGRIPSEYWRVSISLPHPELEELLRYLPEEHCLRARLAPEGNDGYVRREPDNIKLRTALASGATVQSALMRRRFFNAALRRCYFASLRSKRSRFITLTHEFTNSVTNRCWPSDSA